MGAGEGVDEEQLVWGVREGVVAPWVCLWLGQGGRLHRCSWIVDLAVVCWRYQRRGLILGVSMMEELGLGF